MGDKFSGIDHSDPSVSIRGISSRNNGVPPLRSLTPDPTTRLLDFGSNLSVPKSGSLSRRPSHLSSIDSSNNQQFAVQTSVSNESARGKVGVSSDAAKNNLHSIKTASAASGHMHQFYSVESGESDRKDSELQIAKESSPIHPRPPDRFSISHLLLSCCLLSNHLCVIL